jgi:tetratricopeptide (TPR) repeat protein
LTVGRFIDADDRTAAMLARTPDDPELLVYAGASKAHLTDPNRGLWALDQAWRERADPEVARDLLRPSTSSSDDRAAENSFRRAYALDPVNYRTRLGLASFLWATGRLAEGADYLKRMADEQPAASFVHRTLGLYYEHAGRPAEAERYLTSAAAGGDRDSRLALAEYWTRHDQQDRGLAILESLASADDKDGAVAVRVAEVNLTIGNIDRASEWADRTLSVQPAHPRALLVRAQVLLRKHDPAAALDAARRALAADPTSANARLVLARAYANAGDPQRAFDSFVEAGYGRSKDRAVAAEIAEVALDLGRDGVAETFATQSLLFDPANTAAAVTLGTVQVRRGDFTAAARTIGKLPPEPRVLILQAAIQAGRGSIEAARATYMRVLDQHADSLPALSGLVDLEIASGRAAEVRPRVDRAAQAYPRDSGYLLLLARVIRAQGNLRLAEDTLQTILRNDAEHVDAVAQLADLLKEQRRFDDARRMIERAITLRPTSVKLRMIAAAVLEGLGRPADARTQYEEVIKLDEDNHLAAVRLAALYAADDDNLNAALRLASTAKQHLQSDPEVDDVLGWIYVRKFMPASGLSYLESAVRAQPNRADFRYHLGIAYQRMGRIGKAREQLAKALEIEDDFPEADNARQVLSAIGK